jgi:hypothetical protein
MRENWSMGSELYQCEASTPEGFIQQLAVSYVSNGYFFYVVGSVPEGKDPLRVDAKLIDRYNVGVSKWSRARRKRAGAANVQYLRHARLFVLLATHGEHPFFADEGRSVRDVRRVPLKAFGYAVSYKAGHVHVRIEREEFKRLRAHFLELATHRKLESVASEFSRLRFEPYAPVRRQLVQMLRAVNRARWAMGFEALPLEALRLRRRIVRPFANPVG